MSDRQERMMQAEAMNDLIQGGLTPQQASEILAHEQAMESPEAIAEREQERKEAEMEAAMEWFNSFPTSKPSGNLTPELRARFEKGATANGRTY